MDTRLAFIESDCREVYFFRCEMCGEESPPATDEIEAIFHAEAIGEFIGNAWFCNACAKIAQQEAPESDLIACPVCGRPRPIEWKPIYEKDKRVGTIPTCGVCGTELSSDDILTKEEASQHYWRERMSSWIALVRRSWPRVFRPIGRQARKGGYVYDGQKVVSR